MRIYRFFSVALAALRRAAFAVTPDLSPWRALGSALRRPWPGGRQAAHIGELDPGRSMLANAQG